MTDPTTASTRLHQGFLTVQFPDIHLPGVYVTQKGEMFRIPREALAENRSPILAWGNLEGSLVTRLAEDPYTPISKCRQIAADADLPVSF